MLFWLQLISCSQLVNMAELHHLCDESSSSCSSDELDSCPSKEHVSDREMLMFSKLAEDCINSSVAICKCMVFFWLGSTFLKLESYLKDHVQKVWTVIAWGSLPKIVEL